MTTGMKKPRDRSIHNFFSSLDEKWSFILFLAYELSIPNVILRDDKREEMQHQWDRIYENCDTMSYDFFACFAAFGYFDFS